MTKTEEITPGENKRSWEERMQEVLKKFKEKAANYSEQEIEDIVNQAVAEVRTENKARKGDKSNGA